MAGWITIKDGDSLSHIGEREGIPWKKIWQAPENESLRTRRGNPNVLFPGDRVFIPELAERRESCGTEQRHGFVRPGKSCLRIVIRNLAHEPISNVRYQFVIDRKGMPEETTGGDGVAHADLPREGATMVRLRLPWGEFPVEVGWLDPAHTVRGVQQRLRNLGIDPGPIDGLWGPLTARAISEFQTVEGLEVTGRPGKELIRRLRKVHDNESLGEACETLEEHPAERNQVHDRDVADVRLGDPDMVRLDPPHIPQDVDVEVDGEGV